MKKISRKVRSFDTQKDKIVIANDEEQQNQGEEEQLDIPRRSPRNTETLVSTNVPTPGFDTVKIHHEPELQGGFKALKDKGLRITNYQEDIPK
jgi:kynurenine formamidase